MRYVYGMIRQLRITNFKSARGLNALDLEPLTLLTGANSSGKSSVLQALLALVQTASNKSDERALILNGALTRLGSFSDVVSHGIAKATLGIGIDVDVTSRTLGTRATKDSLVAKFTPQQRQKLVVGMDVKFGRPTRVAGGSLKTSAERLIRLDECRINVRSLHTEAPNFYVKLKRSPNTHKARARQLNIRDGEGPAGEDVGLGMLVSLDRDSRTQAGRRSPRESGAQRAVVGATLNHFLPQYLTLKVDAQAELMEELETDLLASHGEWIVSEAQDDDRAAAILSELAAAVSEEGAPTKEEMLAGEDRLEVWRNWVATLDDTSLVLLRKRITSWQPVLLREYLGVKKPVYDLQYGLLPETVRQSVAYVDSFLRNKVQYIGPLRSAPSPNHPLAPTEELSKVGTQGQHTAAVLYNFRSRQVRNSTASVDSSTRSLEDEVGSWLNYLGLGQGVRTRDLGNMGYELKILDEFGQLHDLTQLGVGVSQVLPILVAGLLAQAGDVLLLEQPELHLNPRVQSRLADLLLWLTSRGVQCIVETHSEHIVNRLRRREAERALNDAQARPAIFFVEQSDGISTYRRIDITEFGNLSSWPMGFFDEGQLESRAILMAASSKRKAQ